MKGYDLFNLILMPQEQLSNKCLTRLIKESSDQNIDQAC
jgi:hypothetical protein